MTKTTIRNILMLSAGLSLGGCMAGFDMHGQDPNAYYESHPIKNKVETRTQSHAVSFVAGESRLNSSEIDALMAGLADISPMAVEAVQVQLHPSQIHNDARRTHLVRLLRSHGYTPKDIMFEPMPGLDRNEARIDVSYAAVVLPHCPDWRTSAVTNYSNALNPSNFNCASTVNLGLMAADPRDLEHGSGNVMPDTERTVKVIQEYRTNATSTVSSVGEASASGSASTSTSQ